MFKKPSDLPPLHRECLTLANSHVLLRSLREYREVLEFLEKEEYADCELATYVRGEIEKIEEELRKRDIELEEA